MRFDSILKFQLKLQINSQPERGIKKSWAKGWLGVEKRRRVRNNCQRNLTTKILGHTSFLVTSLIKYRSSGKFSILEICTRKYSAKMMQANVIGLRMTWWEERGKGTRTRTSPFDVCQQPLIRLTIKQDFWHLNSFIFPLPIYFRHCFCYQLFTSCFSFDCSSLYF